MLSERSWIMRKSETIVRKDLAYFLPHMSAALSSFIALQSGAGLWFAVEAEYLPKGRWNGFSLAVCPGSGWTYSHYLAVVVFNWSFCVWLSWILLLGFQQGFRCFYRLHGWLRKSIGYWTKTYSLVSSHKLYTKREITRTAPIWDYWVQCRCC